MSEASICLQGSARASRGHRVVLLWGAREDPHGLIAYRPRRRDRVFARLLAHRLDTQLASGRLPESSRLLAVRADVLVAATSRGALADWWERLLLEAKQPRPATVAGPLFIRGRIALAEDVIRALIAALRAPQPVAARGVADAGLLLSDGTGPVYNVRAGTYLAAAVRNALRHLEPLANGLNAPVSGLPTGR